MKLDDTSIEAHRQLALADIKLKLPDKANAELTSLKTRAATCNDTCSDAADLKAALDAIQAAMALDRRWPPTRLRPTMRPPAPVAGEA